MHAEQVLMEIDGSEIVDLYPDLAWVSVETGDELASLFRFELRMPQRGDGTWAHVDDERLGLWSRVVIGAGFEDGTEPVMTGYITHVLPVFDPDPARCRLQVWGMDATVLLDREEKLRAWPGLSDSDIASAVIGEYGLTADVEATEVVHDERVSTVMQRESDAVLLRRLASRNGYACWVDGDSDGDVVHFRRLDGSGTAQPVLAVHFGEETTVMSFSVQASGPGPTGVSIAQLDRTEKTVVTADAGPSEREAQGAAGADGLLAPGIGAVQSYVAQSPTTGAAEMRALAQAAFEQSQWFVTAEAIIDGNRYGTVLRPRLPVLVKGAGDTHSGEYDVTAVTHRLGIDGYQQHVSLRRNALGLTGREDFGSGAGELF
jgi:phage protein D